MERLSMIPRSVSRNPLRTCQRSSPKCLQQQTRQESSFRRAKTALRIPPATSFSHTTENQDHIIYNPPSSAPNVYHTPLKFLPKSDPRWRLHQLALQQQQAATNAAATAAEPNPYLATRSRLPAPVRPIYEKKYHLTAEDINEIKRLRTEDPRTWTRVRLAEKFKCSQFFVSLCATAPEIARERENELEAIKKRWGRKKVEAREDRQRRKEGWGRDS